LNFEFGIVRDYYLNPMPTLAVDGAGGGIKGGDIAVDYGRVVGLVLII
jgi:hypothetical protein